MLNQSGITFGIKLIRQRGNCPTLANYFFPLRGVTVTAPPFVPFYGAIFDFIRQLPAPNYSDEAKRTWEMAKGDKHWRTCCKIESPLALCKPITPTRPVGSRWETKESLPLA